MASSKPFLNIRRNKKKTNSVWMKNIQMNALRDSAPFDLRARNVFFQNRIWVQIIRPKRFLRNIEVRLFL